MAAKPVPDGYHTVTPYLTVRGAAKVIEFLKQAFGAEIPEEHAGDTSRHHARQIENTDSLERFHDFRGPRVYLSG